MKSLGHGSMHTYTRVLFGKVYPDLPVKNMGYPTELLCRMLIILEDGRSIEAPDGI